MDTLILVLHFTAKPSLLVLYLLLSQTDLTCQTLLLMMFPFFRSNQTILFDTNLDQDEKKEYFMTAATKRALIFREALQKVELCGPPNH